MRMGEASDFNASLRLADLPNVSDMACLPDTAQIN